MKKNNWKKLSIGASLLLTMELILIMLIPYFFTIKEC